MIWGGDYRVKLARHEGCVYLSFGEQNHCYYFPLVCHDLKQALALLIADAGERGLSFRMWGMTQEQNEQMEVAMPQTFDFSLDLAGSDYIYSAQELGELKGRKFEKKRNHLARFKRSYSYTYEDISPDNLSDCVSISTEWHQSNIAHGGASVDMEYCALRKAVVNYEQLGLQGGLIRIEGKPVAFTIGEEINSEVFLLHFEKALDGYDGLYAAINHEYAARHLAKYKYINREEDMGIEGLQKSKMSYHPVFLVEKYRAVLKEADNV